MGDVIHALPAAIALRNRFPRSHISWLVDERFAPILRPHPAVDRIICAPRVNLPHWWPRADLMHATRQYALAPLLRHENFDLVIDLQGLFRTGVLTAATGARLRIGFANAREGAAVFYTRRQHLPRSLHAADRCLKLLNLPIPTPPIRYDLYPTGDARAQAAGHLHRLGLYPQSPFLVICPRSANPIKEWPPEHFAQLCRAIWETHHLPSLLLGTRSDEPVCRQIADQAGRGVYPLTGTPLDTSMALIAASGGMIANDSGPLHLAVALQKPVIGIYGPTDPARTGPYGHPEWVIRQNSTCAACRKKRWRVAGHTCLTQLPAEVVLRAVQQYLIRPE